MRARLEVGFDTQAQLADALGVNIKTVNRWENGRTLPSRRDVFAIAHVTGVDVDWLLGDEGEAHADGAISAVQSSGQLSLFDRAMPIWHEDLLNHEPALYASRLRLADAA